jgi:hypothetical protein
MTDPDPTTTEVLLRQAIESMTRGALAQQALAQAVDRHTVEAAAQRAEMAAVAQLGRDYLARAKEREQRVVRRADRLWGVVLDSLKPSLPTLLIAVVGWVAWRYLGGPPPAAP